MGYKGWAVFADGDMICNADIAELYELRDESKAVMVVKHDYQTKHPIKYLGNKNEDYPRKNWSSLVLWNCGHPSNRALTPEYVASASGARLHRFAHLQDDEIGELPAGWNWLVGEYEFKNNAKILHYTLGAPCFEGYEDCDNAKDWQECLTRALCPL